MLLVVLGGVVAVAGLQVATNRGLITSNPLSGVLGHAQSVTQFLPSTASDQLQVLSERTGTVTQEVGTVLGSSMQVETVDRPLHEKAFEHGRYLYCQQVIKEYEARTKSNEE